MRIISVSLALATTAVSSADQAHKLSPRHRFRPHHDRTRTYDMNHQSSPHHQPVTPAHEQRATKDDNDRNTNEHITLRRMQNGGPHHGQNGGHKGPRPQHARHTHPPKDHSKRGHHHKQAEDDGTSDEEMAALFEDDTDGPQACPFCPDGLTMDSDYVLPTNSRQDDPITCGQVQDFASTLVILPEPADSSFEKEECAKVQLAEIFCCPSDEELDIIEDEEGGSETQEPSQEETAFPTEPTDTDPTALPDDVSPEATSTTTEATTLPEDIDIDEPTVTPGDDMHGSDEPILAGAKSAKAQPSAGEYPSSSKSNKTNDAKAGKDDPVAEQHPTKKSSSTATTSKTGKEASEKSASTKGDAESKSGKESSTTASKAEKGSGLSMPPKEKSSGGVSKPPKMSSAKTSKESSTPKQLGTKAAAHSMPSVDSSMPSTAGAKSSKLSKTDDDTVDKSSSTAKSSKKEQGDSVPTTDKSKSSKSEELHKVDVVDAKAQKTDTKAQKTDSAKAQKQSVESDANNNNKKSGKTSKTVVVHDAVEG